MVQFTCKKRLNEVAHLTLVNYSIWIDTQTWDGLGFMGKAFHLMMFFDPYSVSTHARIQKFPSGCPDNVSI